ncbi:Butirosin biosynthesis, BtrG-like protein [Xylariomycetidae sp. FL2044]|nr:Butirosin biosynthesis, BtrG-like protein [Xylariomycetidae sp. FL2044]
MNASTSSSDSRAPPPPPPPPPLLYFAYGSNLSETQMHQRCPNSAAVGLARLPGWSWLINERGYANITRAPSLQGTTTLVGKASPGVYGVLYRLAPEDERTLDLCEGVPWAYERYMVQAELLENGKPKEKVQVLAYVDFKRTNPATPKQEYVYRMNRGIEEAAREWKLPSTYIDEVMRPFIPAEPV